MNINSQVTSMTFEEAKNYLEGYVKKVSILCDRVLDVIQLHEVNRIFYASDSLSKQIPASYAAHAFNSSRNALIQMEIIKLVALWDNDRDPRDNYGLRTLLCELGKEPEIVEEAIRIFQYGISNVVPKNISLVGYEDFTDAERESFLARWRERDMEQSEEISHQRAQDLQLVLSEMRNFYKGNLYAAIYDLRTQFAHATFSSRILKERRIKLEDIPKIDFDSLEGFFTKSREFIDRLYLILGATSFDWEGSMRFSRENAQQLLLNCRFTISENLKQSAKTTHPVHA